MAKSPGNNVPKSDYVTGSGKDTQIFGVPYETYKHMSPESQSYYYQQAINKKKNDENAQLEGQIQGLKENINSERGKNIKNLQSKQKDDVGFFSRLFGNSAQENQAYNQASETPDIQQAEKTLSDLDMYKREQQDDAQGLNEVQKGINKAGRRLPETLKSIGTFGISRIADAIKQNKANSEENNELTKRANELYDHYTTLNKLDDSIGRDIASGALQSAEYASQFAATGGLAAGATIS